MKKNAIYLLMVIMIAITSCNNLDLSPLSEGSSEQWYSNETEIIMALNKLYQNGYWPTDDPKWTDDFLERDGTSPVVTNTVTSETSFVVSNWANAYSAIANANIIITSIEAGRASLVESVRERFIAEARFHRASQYAYLIARYGDVVYYTNTLNLEEAFSLGKTSKAMILQAIYEDLDFAASKLPAVYEGSQLRRATSGAAYAMKARTALYEEDWEIARDAAKKCIDLGIYELYSEFDKLFISSTKNTKESVFGLPRSRELGVTVNMHGYKPRNVGGLALGGPSWDLFCSFLSSDGLPIDQSPLFNPREPFKNRDPRLSKTIVEFGTPHLGFIYQPHPDSLMVLNLSTGIRQQNNDSRGIIQWASYNGLIWKKGIEEEYAVSSYQGDPEKFIIRYADVLLMYAESKIELGEIDQSVLDAINMVRARAYGVADFQSSGYPKVITTSQSDLRRIVRTERRMEFANEGPRYMDIIRWRTAEKVLNRPNYAMLDLVELRERIVSKGLWFLPEIPAIDEEGIPDFTSMYNKNLIRIVATKKFDPTRQYLWPIPAKEIQINPNLTQNEGY